MMKGMAIWVVLLLMAPAWYALPSSTAESTSGQLRLLAVNPSTPGECLQIMNVGEKLMALQGTAVTDGEGTLTFQGGSIGPQQTIFLAQNSTIYQHLLPEVIVIDYTDPIISRVGRFALANEGDQLLLSINGTICDMVCYGSVEPPSGWDGPTCVRPAPGHLLRKISPLSPSNAPSFWEDDVLGRKTFGPEDYTVDAMPFLFPEAGHVPIVDLIHNASQSIIISVYTLDDEAIVAALLNARMRQVKIDILLEGQPVGGMTAAQSGVAATLSAAGCQVLLMTDASSFRRYDFVHAKYAVFDGTTVLVTSENWGQGLHNNRGWGVMIKSVQMASRFAEIFAYDTERRWGDLSSPKGAVVSIDGCSETSEYQPTSWITAEVTLVVSPDSPLSVVSDMISASSDRLYVEQMGLDSVWAGNNGLIDEILQAGGRGVETKVLLDSSTSDLQNRVAVNDLLEPRVASVEAQLASTFHEFRMIHNKGIISDDAVLVSSINMGRNAFSENREVGVVIRSQAIANFFAEAFLNDWSADPDPPHLILQNVTLSTMEGGKIVLDASGSWDRSGISNISWDLDLDGNFEKTGLRILVAPEEISHDIMVRATDNYGNFVQEMVTVPGMESPSSSFTISPLYGLIPLTALALLFLRKRIK
jgi:cardiolipin synthase A/B